MNKSSLIGRMLLDEVTLILFIIFSVPGRGIISFIILFTAESSVASGVMA